MDKLFDHFQYSYILISFLMGTREHDFSSFYQLALLLLFGYRLDAVAGLVVAVLVAAAAAQTLPGPLSSLGRK